MTTSAERPLLSLVKDEPPSAVEGAVFEHQGRGRVLEPRPRPAWMMSSQAMRDHARYALENAADWVGHHAAHSPYYVGWSVRGYRRLGRRWLEAHRDFYPQLIASARRELAEAVGDPVREDRAKALVRSREAEYGQHKKVHWVKSAAWGGATTAGGVAGVLVGGFWIDLLLAVAAIAVGACHGRPAEPVTKPAAPVAAMPQEMSSEPEAGPAGETIEAPVFDAPPPPALSEEVLTAALRDIKLIKPDAKVKVLAAPAWGKDGTATTVFDLPAGVTVAMLQKKADALAGALGRDVSMIDVTKAGAAGRPSLWMTDEDPFARPRRSPLLSSSGGIDAFRDGVPVAWGKRGNVIALPISNSNAVIAGMTRSGKGVGASNLIVGASLDHRINLRIVAGKTNGEFDAYAKTGVAATYFKQRPERLLALTEALLSDLNRRNAVLGELGKSKLTAETIERLGGIEVLVIDEVATFTRPGKPLRDELLENLIELSAVAAGAGILVVLITQYPEVDVLPQGLAMNCGTRWAMRVDNATQSNAILGGGASASGRDASKFDPPIPGLGWLVNPFAGVTDLARSFDLDEDQRGEISQLLTRAAELREAAGRLVGQWGDPVEQHLLATTGLSSAAGGPRRNGEPGRAVGLTGAAKEQHEAVQGALAAMDRLGRKVAQLDEMAELIGDGMSAERLGELLRAAGAGGTVKVTIEGRGRVNGYRREDITSALDFLEGA
ncbi:FtsK/SpoIIIE domain-containing protein [Streptomyces ehimensis]|uniref:FtsK/SpoIIIE domain-containing protein n=1 Tax=Streptomyces ehimensis TaxID=68195 RepID=A0ABV9BEV3_9ACTN